MMTIDNETVKRVAFLSRLKIEDDKIEDTKNEFNKIINWMSELDEVDTSSVEPLVSVNDNKLTLREDDVVDGNKSEAILANAPIKEYSYFVVPKVIDGE